MEIRCKVFDYPFWIWVDTGSPNTLVSVNFHKRFGLSPIGKKRYNGKVAGVEFQNKPSITIPEIVFPNCLPLRNVRALAALENDEWDKIIILGLNVINHLTFKVDRINSTFEWLEMLTADVPSSERTKLNHLIINGVYLLGDEDN